MTLRVRALAIPAVLAGMATLMSLWPAAFVLDREAVMAGEAWRLYTGHLVHATAAHFFFDVGVAVLLLLFVPLRRSLLLLPPLVGGIVLLARPDLSFYGGLSGVLHGLTVLAAVHLARGGDRTERVCAGLLLVGVLAKAMGEAVFQTSLVTGGFDMGGETVYVAHLAGVLGGLVLAAVRYRSARRGRNLPAWARGVESSPVR